MEAVILISDILYNCSDNVKKKMHSNERDQFYALARIKTRVRSLFGGDYFVALKSTEWLLVMTMG